MFFDGVAFGLDIEWIEHSQLESIENDIHENNALFASNILPQNWEDGVNIGVGAEWQYSDTLKLRTGVIFLETPVPSETLIPEGAEEDYAIVSIGMGYEKNKVKVDLSYAYGIFDGRTVTDNQIPALNGTYDLAAHLIGVSVQFEL